MTMLPCDGSGKILFLGAIRGENTDDRCRPIDFINDYLITLVIPWHFRSALRPGFLPINNHSVYNACSGRDEQLRIISIQFNLADTLVLSGMNMT